MTSTTALVNGDAVEHAAQLSHEVPALGVGMHFVLTLGIPLSPMPGLARDGQLGKWIWEQAEQGTLPLEEITRELDCQFNRFVDLFGREPTHIDSHHHVHMIPALFRQWRNLHSAKAWQCAWIVVQALHGLSLSSVPTTDGFSSAFYGDEISEALFLQVLDESAARGNGRWK